MLTSTDASHELALYVINDGKHYDRRLDIARGKHSEGFRAFSWQQETGRAVRDYEREFGAPDDRGRIFTACDILLAAAEVAEYYRRHVAEMEGANNV